MHDYWATALQASGKLRADRDPADAIFTNADLARNFDRIAFFTEADPASPTVSKGTSQPAPLNRWEEPIRYTLMGEAVTQGDVVAIEGLMARVTALTGLPALRDETDPNFLISITTPEERDEGSRVLGRYNPDLQQTFDAWRRSPNWICGAWLGARRDSPNTLSVAFIFIGDEVSGISRLSCIEEEIIQSLGLRNDDPRVRPSIFNDDDEFALLTNHDEYLLRILYDRRLRPGMRSAEARPIVQRIVEEIRPGG
ncbi:MAG: DUF2927 domain-containing protein [Pseudomonadota bacterium]